MAARVLDLDVRHARSRSFSSSVRTGVPGFNFIQDPIEYGTRTHHSNVDTYERLVIDDLKQAATVVAQAALIAVVAAGVVCLL